jgi:hypothetical protein
VLDLRFFRSPPFSGANVIALAIPRSASVMRAWRLSRFSISRLCWAGSGQSLWQRMQACSCMDGMPKDRPQVPVETLRR